MRRLRALVVTGALMLASPLAMAQDRACRVSSFSGATTGQGADATMTVRNTGRPCRIVNFGLPAEKKHPATSGRITQAPAHGTATFEAPAVSYLPAAGFTGDDEFAYEARATGSADQSVVLKVRVKVTIVAP